jgi:hypothetical protein
MRVHSDQFKIHKINVTKVKRNKKTSEIILLFTVDRGVRVYDRYLDDLGNGNFGMNYNGNYIEMKIKF